MQVQPYLQFDGRCEEALEFYKSALGGLTGPKGTQMPPRGGNDKLTDDQVRSAVDYMMAIVK